MSEFIEDVLMPIPGIQQQTVRDLFTELNRKDKKVKKYRCNHRDKHGRCEEVCKEEDMQVIEYYSRGVRQILRYCEKHKVNHDPLNRTKRSRYK